MPEQTGTLAAPASRTHAEFRSWTGAPEAVGLSLRQQAAPDDEEQSDDLRRVAVACDHLTRRVDVDRTTVQAGRSAPSGPRQR